MKNYLIIMVFGLALLTIGLAASFYQEQHYIYHVGIHAVALYHDVGMALVIIGVAFVAIGFYAQWLWNKPK